MSYTPTCTQTEENDAVCLKRMWYFWNILIFKILTLKETVERTWSASFHFEMGEKKVRLVYCKNRCVQDPHALAFSTWKPTNSCPVFNKCHPLQTLQTLWNNKKRVVFPVLDIKIPRHLSCISSDQPPPGYFTRRLFLLFPFFFYIPPWMFLLQWQK